MTNIRTGKYIVVTFNNEELGSCDIVHRNWLISPTKALWPDDTMNHKKYLLQAVKDENWRTVDIRIVYQSDDYLKAYGKLKEYEKGCRSSCLDTDVDEMTRKKISREKRKRKILTSSDSDQECFSMQKPSNGITFPSFRKVLSPFAHHNTSVNSQQSAVSHTTPPEPFKTPKSHNHQRDLQSTPADDSSLHDSLDFSIGSKEQSHAQTCNGHLDENSSLFAILVRLEKKIDKIVNMSEKHLIQQQYASEDIKEIKKNQGPQNDVCESEIFSLVPIRSKEDFAFVQEILNDESEKRKMIKFLTSRCGKQRDSILENCLRELLHEEMSPSVNFSGLNGKIKMEGSWVLTVIQAVLLRIGLSMTQKELNNGVKLHMKRTYDTFFQRRKRHRSMREVSSLDTSSSNEHQDETIDK